MITPDDLIARFGKSELAGLSDKEHYERINETIINHAINDAQALIYSYLAPTGLIKTNTQGLPVYVGHPPHHPENPPPVPQALIIKACDLARFYLYDDGAPDIVQKRYDDAMAWLKLVAARPAMLTGTPTQNGQSGICVIAAPMPNLYGTNPGDYWE